jgi:hypothetical protein
MKPLYVSLISISCLAFSVAGHSEESPPEEHKCSCAPYPFRPDPPCFDICVKSIAKTVSQKDLLYAFGQDAFDSLDKDFKILDSTESQPTQEMLIRFRREFENAAPSKLNQVLESYDLGIVSEWQNMKPNTEMEKESIELWEFPDLQEKTR